MTMYCPSSYFATPLEEEEEEEEEEEDDKVDVFEEAEGEVFSSIKDNTHIGLSGAIDAEDDLVVRGSPYFPGISIFL